MSSSLSRSEATERVSALTEQGIDGIQIARILCKEGASITLARDALTDQGFPVNIPCKRPRELVVGRKRSRECQNGNYYEAIPWEKKK